MAVRVKRHVMARMGLTLACGMYRNLAKRWHHLSEVEGWPVDDLCPACVAALSRTDGPIDWRPTVAIAEDAYAA